MKRMWLIMIAIALVPGAALSQAEGQPEDLIECIDQIKAWNMSELARGCLSSIAGIRLNSRIMSFQKDESSGAYFPSFAGTTCHSPDRDPEEVKREREQLQYRLDGEVIRLRPLADFDGSGFVSTSEGSRFRDLVEFGYKAAYVVSVEKGESEGILKGLMMNEETLDEKLGEYKDFMNRAKRFGIEDLPEVALD